MEGGPREELHLSTGMASHAELSVALTLISTEGENFKVLIDASRTKELCATIQQQR